MAIWFFQVVGKAIHFIDYLESSGEGLGYYIKILKEKKYIYGQHHAPHDIKVRELSTGKTRLETASALGIEFEVAERLSIEDGIDASRNFLNRCWFDKIKCSKGVSALRSYHKDWDEENKVFRLSPKHDWASHGSDAFRTFSVGYREIIISGAATAEPIRDDPYD